MEARGLARTLSLASWSALVGSKLLFLRRHGVREEREILRRACDREDEREIDEHAADLGEVDDAEIDTQIREVVRVARQKHDDPEHLEGRLRLALLAGGDDHAFTGCDTA